MPRTDTEFLTEVGHITKTVFKGGGKGRFYNMLPKKDHQKQSSNSTDDYHIASYLKDGCHPFTQHIYVQEEQEKREKE